MAQDVPSDLIYADTGLTMRKAIQLVRVYLRDLPGLNRLVDGVESTERFVAFGIQDALSDWNSEPPIIGYVGLTSHPAPHLLIRRAAATVLEGVMHLQVRNHLTYNDGSGATVRTSDKGSQLQGIINWMVATYDAKKKNIKIALNLEQGWGGIHSELVLIGGYYGWS